MTLTITLLGTGSPIPSADRAGPVTLISAGSGPTAKHYLVDARRGVLMRLAACGVGAPDLAAVLITHLHSDHIIGAISPRPASTARSDSVTTCIESSSPPRTRQQETDP